MALLTKQVGFSASHFYYRPDLSEADNQALFRLCANRHGHGHNYLVEVTLKGEADPETGMLMNFFDLDPILQAMVVDVLDHKNLNKEIPFFETHIPTLEHIAQFLWGQLQEPLEQKGHVLHNIKVIENTDLNVTYAGQAMYLTRKYTFSAAHRLWRADWSTDQNQEQFGRCTNVHGHTYTLAVTVSGEPAKETGMVIDIAVLDELLQEHVLQWVDHKHLDEDVPFLEGTLSTVENVAQCFFQRLEPTLSESVQLERVHLAESEANWVEVIREEMMV